MTTYMLPWDWGVHRSTGGRAVFDCTDDWARLLPHRQTVIRRHLARIAGEADEIIVVNGTLTEHFPGRTPIVVPNGTDEELLRAPRATDRKPRHAVYVGSISERFDVELIERVIAALPDWTLSIYGQLVFGRRAAADADRFRQLPRRSGGRITYGGLLTRDRLAAVLDAATVALIPDDPRRSLGQSSMKSYDYCARGLPVVATAGHLEFSSDAPPHMYVASGTDEMVAAMEAAADEPEDLARARVAWAEARTWGRRVDAWQLAALGTPSGRTAD